MNALPGQLELTPTDIAVEITSQQLLAQSACAALSSLREDPGAEYLLMPNRNNDAQLELTTVIDHTKYYQEWQIDEASKKKAEALLDAFMPGIMRKEEITQPAGIRLAKMLSQYDDQPSSQLWGDIQRLAREILK